MLRRLKPALRQSGIDVQLDPDRKRDGFHVSITKINRTEKSPVNIVNMFQRKNIHLRT